MQVCLIIVKNRRRIQKDASRSEKTMTIRTTTTTRDANINYEI